MVPIFSTLSVLAVIAGGLLAAFSARRPTRLASWLSAYLVLIVGTVQLGLIVGWNRLGTHGAGLALAAFMAYNLGNICVIAGTALKHRHAMLVNTGGILLAIAMILLLWTAKTAAASWALGWFVALVIIILVSMPIGLALSARRRKSA